MSEIPDDIKIAAQNALADGPEHMLPDYGVNEEALIDAIGRSILFERQRHAEVMEEVRKVLEPFANVADAILAEAPTDAAYYSVFMDCEGKSWRLTTDQLRAVCALLSRLEER